MTLIVITQLFSFHAYYAFILQNFKVHKLIYNFCLMLKQAKGEATYHKV